MIKLLYKHFELLFWVTGLVLLAVTQPNAQTHFSLCLFKLAGFTRCPGCGIGHALSYLLHGQVLVAWQHHWLGIPALLTIFYRIYSLSFKQMFNFKKLKLNRHGI